MGHFFGRDGESVGIGVLSRMDERIVRVSDEVLNRCLRLVLEVAIELEAGRDRRERMGLGPEHGGEKAHRGS